ncbi:MAG: hypothetical protein FJ125_00470 [Deltaproteobacteria bacterium]|nr:hypothetical protein [Deltaproteobacteria bacterium]
MDTQLVRFVLPPPEEPARRALLGSLEALRAARPELTLEPLERLDLPTLGRMAEGPALVVAERPLALPRQSVGTYLVAGWAIDPGWARYPGHLYAVAHPVLIDPLARLGIDRSCIAATGLPLASIAGPLPPRGEARERLGLSATATMLIVMAEGLDPSSLDPLLFQLTLLSPAPTLVFFAGEDTVLRSLLRRKVPSFALDARLLGDIGRLADLLAAADMALCSAEAICCAEVLTASLPALVLPARRSVAEEELRFLGEQGAVKPIAEIRTLAAEIDLLRPDAEARQRMRSRAAALLQPEPLAAFLALIQRGLAERELLLRTAPTATGTAQAPADEQPVLEDLGAAPGPHQSREAGPAAIRHPLGGPTSSDRWSTPSPQPGQRLPAASRSVAELIATEKATRTRFEEASTDLARWRRRVGLAVQAGDVQLQELAAQEAERLEGIVARLTEELERLARHRLDAQRVASAGGSSHAEERFRQLELEAELRALKRRMEEQ